MSLPRQVVKRDGKIVPFDDQRILGAITKAMRATKGQEFLNREQLTTDGDKPQIVLKKVRETLNEKYGSEGKPPVEDIQNIVEQCLMEFGLYDVAKSYVLYRKERQREREEKERMLEKDSVDEVDKLLSLNAIRLLTSRYLIRNERGKIIETPKQMFQRTAALIVIPDILHDTKTFDKEGKQKKHDVPVVDYAKYEGKLGLGRGATSGSYEVTWNKFHIQRMFELYQELNELHMMKLAWDEFLSQLAKKEFEQHYSDYARYYNLMVKKQFMPNSPTLFNAGARLGQLSACFVIPIEDSIESIMKSATNCALIFQSGGGVGINYSALRPEGDIVASTGGIASGPVTFMRIIDTVTDVVKQGGKRRGANMGILEISHPDIEKFVKSKRGRELFENFNISVLIDPKFWNSYKSDELWPLRNPRNGEILTSKNPRELFREIAVEAWNAADPGVVFLDNINKDNPLLGQLGEIRCVNPCGEQPLYPYESCNLGSINLFAFVSSRHEDGMNQKRILDWNALSEAIRTAIRFLDNVIDVNKFPIREIARVSKMTRRVGLGIMGLADTLFALSIQYNSEKGFEFMGSIAEFFAYHSTQSSIELAKERGPFPLFKQSSYGSGELPFEGFRTKNSWTRDWKSVSDQVKNYGIRNSHTLTIAPTGSISMIVDTSSGLEPQFALVFEKHVSLGSFYYTDPELQRQLSEIGGINEDILKKIADNGGSMQSLNKLGESYSKLKDVFMVAYDIPWWDHLRAQYEMQRWISTSVSKTINLPSWATIEDIEKAYLFAYKLGLKGITVYRDGSKGEQVLRTPSQRENKYIHLTTNKTFEMMSAREIEPPLTEIAARVLTGKSINAAKTQDETEIVYSSHMSVNRIIRCTTCGGTNVVSQEGCQKCLDCGWSTCTVA